MSEQTEVQKADLIAVRVTARRDGWWRAGKQWSAAGTEASVAADVLAVLEAEPMLVVERLPETAGQDAGAGTGKKA